MRIPRIAVLCSSGGSAFFAARRLLARRAIEFTVITDRPCGAETMCDQLAIPYRRISASSNEEFSGMALAHLQEIDSVDYIALLFSRLITPTLFRTIPCFNIHPSLLPAFAGMNAVHKAYLAKARFLGATLHFVDKGIDTGPILAQVCAPILREASEKWLDRISFAQKTYLFMVLAELLADESMSISDDLSRCALNLDAESSNGYANPTLKARDLQESFRDLMMAEGITWMP